MDCAETFCKRIYYVVSGKEDLSKNGVIGSLNSREFVRIDLLQTICAL